ncbi:MAG: glucose-6-phosphate dehydrogenase [Patescibacteria group bacterium]
MQSSELTKRKKLPLAPVGVIIFGATGDLATKKLFPSLARLFADGHLRDFFIVGLSRQNLNNETFRNYVASAVGPKYADSNFLSKIEFVQGDFSSPESFQNLGERIAKIDDVRGVCSDKVYYLAVPPILYGELLENLATSGLTVTCGGLSRIAIEKPFGSNYLQAQVLDKKLSVYFKENEIYRIDHYLAKETIQNILTFRFSNSIFPPLFTSEHIERIEAVFSEKNVVGSRAGFYESVGALLDVGQNHILQMVAAVTMENPGEILPASIRTLRAEAISRFTFEGKDGDLTVGQYDGYRDEHGVASISTTETFFKMKFKIIGGILDGVPVTATSGKGLAESRASVSVFFKKGDCTHQNILTFWIQPNEGIAINFYSKAPGFTKKLASKMLDFSYSEEKDVRLPDAYERVLFDLLRGDETLFGSTDEVMASWRFITPVLEMAKKLPLMRYNQGTLVEELF